MMRRAAVLSLGLLMALSACAETPPPEVSSAAAETIEAAPEEAAPEEPAIEEPAPVDRATTDGAAADGAAAEETPVSATEINDARLAVAEALTNARLTRAALLQEAMALAPDNPRWPVLADRAERLKRLEADLVATRDDLRAARAPDSTAAVARRSVMRAQAASTRLRALTARFGQ